MAGWRGGEGDSCEDERFVSSRLVPAESSLKLAAAARQRLVQTQGVLPLPGLLLCYTPEDGGGAGQ